MYIVYADRKNKLIAIVGEFKKFTEAQAFDAGVNHIAGNWMVLEGTAPSRQLAWDKAREVRQEKYPNFELQDQPVDQHYYQRMLACT